MELILLIAIAILVTVLLVLALTKGNNQTQAEQLQIALRQQMQENREELNRSIRELRNIYFIEKQGDILGVTSNMNMEILSSFNKAGLEFAFPTQTVYIQKDEIE